MVIAQRKSGYKTECCSPVSTVLQRSRKEAGQGPFKLASQSNGLDCDHRALIPLLSSPRQKRPRESGGDGMWKTRGEDRISQAG